MTFFSLVPGSAVGGKPKHGVKKENIGERSELLVVTWGWGKGGGAWRHVFDAAVP